MIADKSDAINGYGAGTIEANDTAVQPATATPARRPADTTEAEDLQQRDAEAIRQAEEELERIEQQEREDQDALFQAQIDAAHLHALSGKK